MLYEFSIEVKVNIFPQVTSDLEEVALGVDLAAPSLLIVGQMGDIKEVFLLGEQRILCKIKPIESPLLLLADFYSYNMSYPKGLQQFYSFLEYCIIDKTPIKYLDHCHVSLHY